MNGWYIIGIFVVIGIAYLVLSGDDNNRRSSTSTGRDSYSRNTYNQEDNESITDFLRRKRDKCLGGRE